MCTTCLHPLEATCPNARVESVSILAGKRLPSTCEGVDIVAVTAATTESELVFGVWHACDISTDLLAGAMIGGALVVAAEVNDNTWAAVLTALELTSPAPLEEPLLAW